jgi:serine/threonine protein kinase
MNFSRWWAEAGWARYGPRGTCGWAAALPSSSSARRWPRRPASGSVSTRNRSAARLSHPNVVLVFDSGEHEGTPYLVMELLPGRTLADEIARGRLEPERARRIGLEVLGALAASHQAGILHRDIKPGNVLLTADDSAKLGDFGIAKSTENLNLTTTGMIVGTAAYLAPERVAGQSATPQSDLYALGVVLYEALSGRKPFHADTPIALMRAVEDGTALRTVTVPGAAATLSAERAAAMAAAELKRRAGSMAMARSTVVTSEASSPGRASARGIAWCASTARMRAIGVSAWKGFRPLSAS